MTTTRRDYKVKTKDGRIKTITVRREHYESFHDEVEHAYVPSATFTILDSVDGKKYKGRRCDVDISAAKIVLNDGKRIQHLKRLVVHSKKK